MSLKCSPSPFHFPKLNSECWAVDVLHLFKGEVSPSYSSTPGLFFVVVICLIDCLWYKYGARGHPTAKQVQSTEGLIDNALLPDAVKQVVLTLPVCVLGTFLYFCISCLH